MSKTITIITQKQFDNIKDDFEGIINIIGNIERVDRSFNNALIYVYNSATIERVYDSATIENVYGSATIKYVSDSATIKKVSGSATIINVYDSATIENVYGSATIKYVYDSATIIYVYNSATIEHVYGSATIKQIYDSAIIENVYGSATIKYVSDSATIKHVYDSATIIHVSGSATILLMTGLASIVLLYSANRIVAKGMNLIRQIGTKKINIEKTNSITLIQVRESMEEEPSFNLFSKLYPVEIKGKKVILYKAVHKINEKYISNYSKDFEYQIGKTIKHDIDNQTQNSCSTGIHVSHKMWSILFGKGWEDMALLECEVPINKIIVSKDCDGKVRTSQLKVIREVPKEEWYD